MTDKIKTVLVCVTDQMHCERIIREGRRIAQEGQRLVALNIQTGRRGVPINQEAIEHLYQVSVEEGAEMVVYYNDFPQKVASEYIRENNVASIVVGKPSGDSAFVEFLIMTFPRVQVNIVGPAGNMTRIKPRLPNMIKGKDGMPVGI